MKYVIFNFTHLTGDTFWGLCLSGGSIDMLDVEGELSVDGVFVFNGAGCDCLLLSLHCKMN